MKSFLLPVAVVFLLFLSPLEIFPQNYLNAVGGRLGYPFGVTVKHFFREKPAVEAILGIRGRGAEAIGLYEHHFYPARRKEFALYVGGGGHFGLYNNYAPYLKDKKKEHNPYLAVGVDGIIGVEWTFVLLPLNMSASWKPGLNLYHDYIFMYADFAISLRYAFRAKIIDNE